MYLGIDVGTSAVKAVLLDATGGRLQARVLSCPNCRESAPRTTIHGATVGAAAGAARLAFMGHTGAEVDAIRVAPAALHTVQPDSALAAHYAVCLPRFRALYRALQPSFLENADA
ncbi:MAG: hypothetical protein ABI645_00335 [Pseudomonadota bacterium]